MSHLSPLRRLLSYGLLSGALIATPVGVPLTLALAPGCTASVTQWPLPLRLDSLVAVQNPGHTSAIALAGALTGSVRFLPHDTLVRLDDGRITWRRALPFSATPPGLALALTGPQPRLYVVADRLLLVIDPRTGSPLGQHTLDMQAIGWPAAIFAVAGRLYLIGQPLDARPARLEAFVIGDRGAQIHRLWQTALGLTHAGIWVGGDASGHLGVYLPAPTDAGGTIELLEGAGVAYRFYAIAAPPLGAVQAQDRLYFSDNGTITALRLSSGHVVATTQGTSPFAVLKGGTEVAFGTTHGLVVADARALHPLVQVTLGELLALAPLPGPTPGLLAGGRGDLIRITLQGCDTSYRSSDT